jgi:hypothetical protein
MDTRLPERDSIFARLRTPAVLDELDHVLVGERPYLLAFQGADALLPPTYRIRNQLQVLSSPRIRDATVRILSGTLPPGADGEVLSK